MNPIEEGYRARRENRLDQAHRYFTLALALAAAGLGQIERDLGHLSRARELYAASVEHWRALDEPDHLAHTLRHEADIARKLELDAKAEALYREALGLYRARVDTKPLDLANSLNGFAALLARSGARREARELTDEALTLYGQLKVKPGVAECRERLAQIG